MLFISFLCVEYTNQFFLGEKLISIVKLFKYGRQNTMSSSGEEVSTSDDIVIEHHSGHLTEKQLDAIQNPFVKIVNNDNDQPNYINGLQ
jgi:hypothetical protein